MYTKTAQYDDVNGEKSVLRAFHLIFATVWPDANVGRLSKSVIQRYIDYAAANDMIVILDHQIGKFDPIDSLKEMLPFLNLGPVHLALDPEWRTTKPGQEIGLMYAHEVNSAQRVMQDYMKSQGIIDKRMLIIHQFHPKMIQKREEVVANSDLVDLILNADGFGSPALKKASWNQNVEAENIPLKGFKLFYPKSWKKTGIDSPIMTPKQVMELKPQPVYINYQ